MLNVRRIPRLVDWAEPLINSQEQPCRLLNTAAVFATNAREKWTETRQFAPRIVTRRTLRLNVCMKRFVTCHHRATSGETKKLNLPTQTFRAWANSQLRVRNVKMEKSLAESFHDGLMLIALVEVLTGEKCQGKYHKVPEKDIHKMENITIAIEFLSKFVKVNVNSNGTCSMSEKKRGPASLLTPRSRYLARKPQGHSWSCVAFDPDLPGRR